MAGALFGLIGVVLGAGMSWAAAVWGDRTRLRHELTLLVRSEKLDVYGAFAIACKGYVAILYRVAGSLSIDDQTESLTLEEAEPLFAEAFHARDSAFERIRLVGSDDSMARARAWVQAIYEMRRNIATVDREPLNWKLLVDRANAARDEFHAQVRSELALSQHVTG